MSLIDQMKRVFDETPAARLAVVFGSSARGDAGARSDLDVGVWFEAGAGKTPSALAVALERATGRRVDLVSLEDAPPLLRFEIARDGVVVVERGQHAWADFRAKAMLDWWDWAPTARMMHRIAAERIRQEGARGPV